MIEPNSETSLLMEVDEDDDGVSDEEEEESEDEEVEQTAQKVDQIKLGKKSKIKEEDSMN